MIRLIIADDHMVVQRGLELLCHAEPGLEVVGLARNSSEVIDLAYQLQPHLVLLDLKMPGIGGAATIRSIRRVAPHSAVLVLTGVVNDDEIVAATSWGIDGYILKDASPDELLRAIRIVAGGLAYLQPAVAKRLLRELATRAGIGPDTESSAPIALTVRELEVLRMMATNRTNREIATAMTVTDETIRSHIKHILAKLQQPNRTQAVLSALRQGLISLDT
jgi:DNA-binding NarL/FixJ family response regulator